MTEQHEIHGEDQETQKLLSRDEIAGAVIEKLSHFAENIQTPALKQAAQQVLKNEISFDKFSALCGQHAGVDDPNARKFGDFFLLEVGIPHIQDDELMNLAFDLARKNETESLMEVLQKHRDQMPEEFASFVKKYFLSLLDATLTVNSGREAEKALTLGLFFKKEMQELTQTPYFESLVEAQKGDPMAEFVKEANGQDVLIVNGLGIAKDGNMAWVGTPVRG